MNFPLIHDEMKNLFKSKTVIHAQNKTYSSYMNLKCDSVRSVGFSVSDDKVYYKIIGSNANPNNA